MKSHPIYVTNNLNDSPLWKKRKQRFLNLIDKLNINISNFEN